MNLYSLLQYLLFLAIITALVKPLGGYMERVFSGKRTMLDRLCLPVERLVYRAAGVDPARQMTFVEYAACFVLFGLSSTLALYAIVRFEKFLPWFYSAYHTTPVSPDLAMNVAVSFSTTTTWQAYSGETTMSYFSQMVGLCSQNFLAGAAGLAVGVAFIRGLAREVSSTLGNFWVDLTRALLWILLPAALLGALLLAWQGVPMNFHPYAVATTVEGVKQVIPQGPVAALEIVKNLGTNGGGFFNANGAHPYENPTPLSNLLEMLAVALLPAALTNTFGRMVGQPRQGWLFYWVMVLLFAGGLLLVHHLEQRGNPLLRGVDFPRNSAQSGGNMEGKEVRFGIGGTTLTAVVTSNAATGSTNAMDDSFTPLGGLVPFVGMMLQCVYGGKGVGFLNALVYGIIAVFVAGLMVGRTPEFLGKKIEKPEIILVSLTLLIHPLVILAPTAWSVAAPYGVAAMNNVGTHGYSEVLYAFASAAANNGSAFAGLNANTPWYNLATALVILIGRYPPIIFMMAVAGSVAAKPTTPVTVGTLRTDTGLFGAFWFGVILVVGALTFVPALVLGPIAEYFAMKSQLLF